MRKKWMVRLSMVAIFLLIVIAGFGQAVLQLWNLLMPDIFGLHPISFWQAVGLMALSWLLFGGLGMFRGRPLYATHWRHRMAERLEQMPPEERERFLQGMRRHCGGDETPTAGPKA
jgi:hypothetical protein